MKKSEYLGVSVFADIAIKERTNVCTFAWEFKAVLEHVIRGM